MKALSRFIFPTLIVLTVLVGGISFSVRAYGYAYWISDCNNDPVRWPNAGWNFVPDTPTSVSMKRLPLSFPDGAAQTEALFNMMTNWNTISMSSFDFTNGGVDDD